VHQVGEALNAFQSIALLDACRGFLVPTYASMFDLNNDALQKHLMGICASLGISGAGTSSDGKPGGGPPRNYTFYTIKDKYSSLEAVSDALRGAGLESSQLVRIYMCSSRPTHTHTHTSMTRASFICND
jgi:hypothetical protein